MSLNCVITVPAGGGNGAPKSPMTDKVTRFLKDSDCYYRAVFSHLKECKVCDPAEALEGYLRNRDGSRMFGRTSGGLVKLAYRFKGKFGEKIPDELVTAFLERSLETNWNGLVYLSTKHQNIGFHNVLRAVDFEEKAWRLEAVSSLKALRKAAKRVGTDRPPLLHPQPLFFLCYQLMRDGARGRDEVNARFHDEARAEVVKFADRDFSKDHDPDVRKAVKMTRILRGGLQDGTILSLPSVEKRPDVLLVDSGYLEDEDEEVRQLARSIVVKSVMGG